MWNGRVYLYAGLLVAGAALGLGMGWKLWRPKAANPETPAVAVRQKDNSLILERKPATLADAKPVQLIPKGDTVERVVKVKVLPSLPRIPSPSPTGALPTPGPGSNAGPNPIEVDLTLVRQKDGSQRVIASSPDGTVVGGVDVPVGPPVPMAKDLHWEAGMLYNPSEHTYGGYLHRSLGPFVLGAQIFQQRLPVQVGGGTKVEGQISLGIRW